MENAFYLLYFLFVLFG